MTHFTTPKLIARSALAVMIAASISVPALAADSGPVLTIENFVGTITTVTGDRLVVQNQDNAQDTRFAQDGADLFIDGGIKKPDGKKCSSYYANYNWSWGKKKERSGTWGGYKDLEDYPALTLTVPKGTQLVIRNAIPFAKFGDLGGVDATMDHCGKVTAGNISGPAIITLQGSGDFIAGNTKDAQIILRGSGDVALGDVGDIDANLVGSGDIKFGQARAARLSLTGSGDIVGQSVASADLSLTGSGDIDIENVENGLTARLQGSGDLEIGQTSGPVDASAAGSGDIYIDGVNGRVDLVSNGSSNIAIDGGVAIPLYAKVSGSGEIDFDGRAQGADLKASGSGDIYIHEASGDIRRSESGSGDIDIDHHSDH